jgi:proteasome lid subunit RPN8/RPN11
MPRPVALPLNELMPTSQTEESGRWEGGAGSPVIEYSNTVLDEIRIRAAEGYQRMRHGGVEVGGVLFGSREDGILRIAAVRPIACGYSNGPRFILSPADEAALAELLLAAADDPALAGLEPLGYYHSHTREEIHMSEANLRLFDRFFPEAWQIALVVRPANLAPTRAGFFFRGPNGVMHSDSGCLEFQLA